MLWLGALYAGAQTQEPAHGDYAARIAELERRRAETPADASVLEALAGSYAMAERYSDAIGVTLQLIELAPAAAAPHLRLARLYAASGELDHALEQVRHVGGDASVEALELKCRILSWKGSAPEAASC
jgi:tetratricopeptide (TPR) repeat protein